MAFSPDGDRLASASIEGAVRLWDPDTGEAIGEPLTGHTYGVEAIAFSPDGDRLASAGHRSIRLWDPHKGEPIGEPLTGHSYEITDVAFSPDGDLLVSASHDGTVRLWDPRGASP